MQGEPPWRHEAAGAGGVQALGRERVHYEAAQVVGGLRLHAGGDLFAEEFEKEVGHGSCGVARTV